jgi:prophage regulatory protein
MKILARPKSETLMQERIVRRIGVQERTGLSRSTIYAMVALGTFPKPIQLGARAVGWPESEITAWLERRKADRVA